MLVGEPSPAPRVVAGLRKLRPELTPAPVPTPTDPNVRITGVLRQYYNGASGEWAWVRAAVRGGCLLAWREGTLPRRPAARLPLRHLHLRAAPATPLAFQLSRLRDDSAVATFQACNAGEYARWVRALCVEILRQTPLPHVRFLDVLPAADTARPAPAPAPPRAPPRARRRLLAETALRRDVSPAATDEGIVVEDDDYDSSSDRSDLSLELKPVDAVDAPAALHCDTCSQLTGAHHTLPRAAREPRYARRWEGSGRGAERSRYAPEAARRKTASLEARARSCSPGAQEGAFVPVKERKAQFESMSTRAVLARSSEHLAAELAPAPRRAASLHDLKQAPPARSVSDLRQYFEAMARGAAGAAGGLRHSAPPLPRACVSLTCA